MRKITRVKMKLQSKNFYIKTAQDNKKDRDPNLLGGKLAAHKIPCMILTHIAYIECSGEKNILLTVSTVTDFVRLG